MHGAVHRLTLYVNILMVIEMIDINTFLHEFMKKLNKSFGERVWFVGLQGSYARKEATEKSDIDIVVILDELTVPDISTYNTMLDSMPHRELICGFLSGKNEILNWETSDLFQFYHDTTPLSGSLDELLPLIDDDAVKRAIKNGVCNIYHGCVHNMLHEKSEEILKELYKSASFVVQAIAFSQTGKYVSSKKDLLQTVSSDEKTIVEAYIKIKNGKDFDFFELSETLFLWCKNKFEN